MPLRRGGTTMRTSRTKATTSSTAQNISGRSIKKSKASDTSKSNIVQVQNPRSGRCIKIDKDKGRIVSHIKSNCPCRNVPIKKSRSEDHH